jgi:enamine deaminase RidA (YjgF/YER057c/UK114 family)
VAVSIDNPDVLHAPVGLYSHVASATGSRMIFVAGQVALDRDGKLVGEGDVAAQTRQVYENLGLALESAGATWADVAKATTFLISEDLIEDWRVVREETFSRLFQTGAYPTHTLVVARGLALPELLVETELVAIV